MADPLGGTRVLVTGRDERAAQALRATLLNAGAAAVDVAATDVEAVGQLVRHRPDAVVVAGVDAGALRAALDPLGVAGGPPLIECDPDAPAAVVVEHVQARLECQALRRRVAELEPVVVAQAVLRSRERDQVELAGLNRLAVAAGYRDDNTREHTQRVAHLAARLGWRLGLGDRSVWLLRQVAPLHDVGKIAIPDAILLKPGSLSPEEFEVIKTHAAVGARVLAGGTSDLLGAAEQVVRSHHERWDGTGYPDGLAGAAIPVLARVVKLADVFDILVHERPHKDAWTDEQAAEEIRRGAGTQFDPDAVQAFDDLGRASWRTPPELLDLA